MTFEIIKNSESKTGYKIPDNEFKGLIPGLLCGWQFEFINANGEINYNSVTFEHMTPERLAYQYGEENAFMIERWNGWQPTGRVIFRGYYEEYYYAEEHDWCVRPVNVA